MTDVAPNWGEQYEDDSVTPQRSADRPDPFRPRPRVRLHRTDPSHPFETAPTSGDWGAFVREIMDQDASRLRSEEKRAAEVAAAAEARQDIDHGLDREASIRSEFVTLSVLLFERHKRAFLYVSVFFMLGALIFGTYSGILIFMFREISIAKLFAAAIFSIASAGFFSLWRAIVRG